MTNDVTSTGKEAAAGRRHWRTVDIVVAAVVAVAFGVVFAGWNALWALASPAFTWFQPAQGIMYGIWLVPGVLGGLLIRKPGAAVFTELVAASVSALFPAPMPLVIVLYGLLQGLARGGGVRRVPLPLVASADGRSRGSSRPGSCPPSSTPCGGTRSGPRLGWSATERWSSPARSRLAGFGSFALVRALARTGVLAPFAAGREQSPA